MSVVASLPPELRSSIPGPRSVALAERLASVESRNVTALAPQAPIFWERARAANVWDVDGNRFLDLGSAFGVANVGHSHPRVVDAVREQAERLLHGMGDVQPPAVKVALLEALVRRFPAAVPARGVLGSSGADAVETALKTALLHSGQPGVLAFEGGYHGLSLGALDTTERSDFRRPFEARLPHRTVFARYGDLSDVERTADRSPQPIGAVLVEPIQGRGGVRVPPDGFLAGLRSLCDRRGWLLIVDEIYTGFGRSGRWFACEAENVVPDLLCVGKGLASGLPISACLGREEVMKAWPRSSGEALHTQTFLGHPVGCAAALASLAVLEEEKLVERSAELGALALDQLNRLLGDRPGVVEVRGRGLMLGIECDTPGRAKRTCARALSRGVILLPAGRDGRVLSITPPLCIEAEILRSGLDCLAECLS
ncbi:MAG: aspartate aminotransferase family protein [Myxococcota bacterium]